MRIALCQINVQPKRPDKNFEVIVKYLSQAKSLGVRTVCFSEMVLPGYLIGDLWEDSDFIKDCLYWQDRLKDKAESLGISLILGNVSTRDGFYGRDGRLIKHNSALAFCVGENPSDIRYNKRNLPSYREFDDSRYFSPGDIDPSAFMVGEGLQFSLSICEDGWDEFYDHKPISNVRGSQGGSPHFHFNLSCSPYTNGKSGARDKRFSEHSKKFSALFYVNNVGIQNNGKNVFTFDGGSSVYQHGKLLGSLPSMEEGLGVVDIQGDNINLLDVGLTWVDKQEEPLLEDVLAYGIREFTKQNGIEKVTIGLSGGIDSALSAMLHVKALGPENVLLLNMPSRYNSEDTRNIAKTIAENLGCVYCVAPIEGVLGGIKSASREVEESVDDFSWDEENTQARIRGMGILASISASTSSVFPNNGNKAETSVGYCVQEDSSLWVKEKGLITLKEVDTDFTVSQGKINQVLPSKVSDAIRLETVIGNSLTTSLNHMYKTKDSTTGSVSFSKACDIKEGDLVCVEVGGGVFGTCEAIPKFSYTKSDHDYRSVPINFPTLLSKDLSKMIGIFLADGSSGGKSNGLYVVTTTKRNVSDFVTKVLVEEVGLPASCITSRKDKRYGSLGIVISNTQFVEWLKRLGISQGALLKDVPAIIKESTEDNIKSFLSGLMLDSSVNSKSENLKEVTYHSSSLSLASFVFKAMLNMGILCYLKDICTDYRKSKNNSPIWEVYIPSSESHKLRSLGIIKNSVDKKVRDNVLYRKSQRASFDFVYGHLEVRRQLKRYFERNKLHAGGLTSYPNRIGRCTADLWLSNKFLSRDLSQEGIDIGLLDLFTKDVYSTERYLAVSKVSPVKGVVSTIDIGVDGVHEFTAENFVVHNCTLGGDHAGYLSPLADLWKYEVFDLSRRLSSSMGEVLPETIFKIKPSAELTAAQSLEGDPLKYWYHDKLFQYWVEPWNKGNIASAAEYYLEGTLLRNLGIGGRDDDFKELFPCSEDFLADLEKWWGLFTGFSIVKKVQSPPIMSVSRRSYGYDYRESIGGGYLPRRYLQIKEDILRISKGIN